MGLFDFAQDILGGVTDNVQGSIGDAVGGIADIAGLQDIQEQVTSVTDGATEAVTSVTDGLTENVASVTEQGQSVVDNITQSFEL